MTIRTLGVALWEYRDHGGRKRRAYFGDTIELTDAEEARGDHAQVFAADPGLRHPVGVTGNTDQELTTSGLQRPQKRAPKADWVEFAVQIGVDRARAEALPKPALISATAECLRTAAVQPPG